MNARRWVVVVLALLVVVGLIAYARGRDHRRGDEVGALTPHTTTVEAALVGSE